MLESEALKSRFPKSDPRGKDLGAVKLVRLNCDGDVQIEKRPKCEGLTVPAGHPIFYNPLVNSISPLSELIKLPLIAIGLPGSCDYWSMVEKEGDDHVENLEENQAATFLLLSCDPEDKDSFIGDAWSRMAIGFKAEGGTVLVARKDKKPLLPDHLLALTDYCQRHLADIYWKNIADNPDGEYDPKKILQEITREQFEKHWHVWKGKQEDKKKRELPSPYSM
ncbi:hypothetical protein K491DRAFT_678130 [Lophiostoma macrostomum CBS 122681]|uniref:Uncharacterized protein n=1 Tax=Lophiostoma macrostomum CBS 122681 TaxID=1314788 RepID=A0A6A6T8W0_9PLEO|nr:hypothetical protein K491DRAFT_678130 [Lophiostoma macrostomum CBS 122681]